MLGREGVGELRVEGVDAGDGDVGVVAPDGVAYGFGEKGGVLYAANEEVCAVGRIVPVGQIDHVDGSGAERVVVCVGDDADHGECVSVALELAVDGALIGPDGFGGGLGDDGGFGSAVVFVERAAFDDALLQSGEVAGTDPAIVCQLAFVVGLAGDDDSVYPAFTGEQHGTNQRCRLNSGKSAEFFEDAVVEAGAVFVVSEVAALQDDVGGNDVVD